MNAVAAIDQTDMIADHDVAVSRRRRFKPTIEVAGHRPNGPPHIGRENESVSNVWLPIAMPIPAFLIAKSVLMVLIPLARNLAIVVVEAIVIVMIPVMIGMIPIAMIPVISLIVLIVMIAVVVILCVSKRYA